MTGRTYPSGIASPVEAEGLCIAASGGDAESSFAIVAFHRVFKQLVVRNFCIVNQVGFFGNTHIKPPLPTGNGWLSNMGRRKWALTRHYWKLVGITVMTSVTANENCAQRRCGDALKTLLGVCRCVHVTIWIS